MDRFFDRLGEFLRDLLDILAGSLTTAQESYYPVMREAYEPVLGELARLGISFRENTARL